MPYFKINFVRVCWHWHLQGTIIWLICKEYLLSLVAFCCNFWTLQQKLHDCICSGCKNTVSQKMCGFYWATLYMQCMGKLTVTCLHARNFYYLMFHIYDIHNSKVSAKWKNQMGWMVWTVRRRKYDTAYNVRMWCEKRMCNTSQAWMCWYSVFSMRSWGSYPVNWPTLYTVIIIVIIKVSISVSAVKPKFHYANFSVTSATSPRQTCDVPFSPNSA